MTLIVSEVSEPGIVMVGDSAISCLNQNGQILRVDRNAKKVIYHESINVCISCWGHASIQLGERILIDSWVSDFLLRKTEGYSSIEDLANKFVAELNPLLRQEIPSDGSWEDVRAGFHIGGFKGEKPVLYHIHCGHMNAECHELRPYFDFPDDMQSREVPYSMYSSPDENQDKVNHPYSVLLSRNDTEVRHDFGSSCAPSSLPKELKGNGFFQLRNGEISEFVSLWIDSLEDAPEEYRSEGNAIVTKDLGKRFQFYVKQMHKVCVECYDMYMNKAVIQSPVVGVCFNNRGLVKSIPRSLGQLTRLSGGEREFNNQMQ